MEQKLMYIKEITESLFHDGHKRFSFQIEPDGLITIKYDMWVVQKLIFIATKNSVKEYIKERLLLFGFKSGVDYNLIIHSSEL
jgi:hypothetical protein